MLSRTISQAASLSIALITLATLAVPAYAATFITGDGSSLAPQSLPSDTAQPVVPPKTPIGQGNTPVQTPIGQGNTPAPTPAPTASGDTSGTLLVNPLKNITSLPALLDAIIKAIVEIGTIVLILALIWVGFSFVRAQGNPTEIAKARSALVWTIIGGAILLGAQALSTVIQSTAQGLGS
jgi:hypothetical protein